MLERDDAIFACREVVQAVVEDAHDLLLADGLLGQLPVLGVPVVGPDDGPEAEFASDAADAVVDITYILKKND